MVPRALDSGFGLMVFINFMKHVVGRTQRKMTVWLRDIKNKIPETVFLRYLGQISMDLSFLYIT